MNLLAFEASTQRLSVALLQGAGGQRALTEKFACVPNGGSERLLPWAHALLAEAGIGLQQLDGIAFGAGPGGFTGLRLACGLAQGLAFGLEIPLVPVCTLAALALSAGDEFVDCGDHGDNGDHGSQILACLDARMNEVYVAAYRLHGETAEELQAPKVGAGETVVFPEHGLWVGVGDGFKAWGEVLRRRLGERLVAENAALQPTASAVARLAAPVLRAGGGVSAAQAAPLYIRDKVALTTAERLARGGSK